MTIEAAQDIDDVRLYCASREWISAAGRLSIGNAVSVTELEASIPGITERYDSEDLRALGVAPAVVPEPRSFRPFDAEDFDRYVSVVDTVADLESAADDSRTRVILMSRQCVGSRWDTLRRKEAQEIIVSCFPNALTTTWNITALVHMGLHVDSTGEHAYRIGNAYNVSRGLLVGARSTRLLGELTRRSIQTSGDVRRVAANMLGPIIRVRLDDGDSYVAWTGPQVSDAFNPRSNAIVHCGTTVLSNGQQAEQDTKAGLRSMWTIPSRELSEVGFVGLNQSL